MMGGVYSVTISNAKFDVAPFAAYDQVATLAMTGVASSAGLTLAGGLIAAGFVGLFFARRRVSTRK